MKKIILAILALCACGSAVSAGTETRDFSAGLGYAMPLGATADLVKGGLGIGLEYEGYRINDTFTVGGSFFSTSAKGRSDAKEAGVSYDLSGVSFSVWGLTPCIKAGKEIDLAGRKATLYGELGLGFYGSKAAAGGVTATSTDFGLNLGGGLMYAVAERMQLGFDLKYHYIAASGDPTTYLVPGAKFTYSF